MSTVEILPTVRDSIDRAVNSLNNLPESYDVQQIRKCLVEMCETDRKQLERSISLAERIKTLEKNIHDIIKCL